jgi:outer membrane protein insertion porin family
VTVAPFQTGPNAEEHDFEVTFKVRESSRLTGGVNTVIGSRNDGQLLLHGRAPNFLGAGEMAQIEWRYGGHDTGGFNFSLSKPLMPWTRFAPRVSGAVYGIGADLPQTGFIQSERGVLADLTFRSLPSLTHSLRFSNAWRTAASKVDKYPREMREQCKHDLKASLTQVHTYDTRDNGALPTTGSLVRLIQEYSGLNGDVQFFKNELELQHNFRLTNRITGQLTASGGWLRPNGSSESSPLDKFYLGGPLSVRGFQSYGIGPKRGDFALGGNAFWAAGAHLYTPLPYDQWLGRLRDQLRTHLFVTAGRLDEQMLQVSSVKDALNVFQDQVRLSAGIGAVFAFGNIARFELNYCWPISAQLSDRREGGLRFGVGINYV